jgi:predicted Zn-dependent peptidase
MSYNLSRHREAQVLGYEFIDPLDSQYPLKQQPAIPPELEVEFTMDETAPIVAPPLPTVPTAIDSSTIWKQSKNGFYQTVLKNGLKVILHQTSAQPVVQCQTVYHFGSNDEIGADERGLAHICEHMIFKGTKPSSGLYLSETDIPAISRMFGASYNAFTSTNITSYHFNSCPEYSEGFLRILAASMFDTKLDEQHLRSEKLAVLAEMSAGKDSIFRDALIHIRQKMYDEPFPQFYPTIGNIADISNLKAETLRDFYNRLYHPRNATLFVVGDMSDDQLNKFKNGFIEQLFSTDVSIEKAGAPVDIGASCSGTPKAGSSFQKVFHTLSENESFMLFSFPLTGMKHDVHTKKAFSAIDTILFDGQGSRLYKMLITNSDLGVTSIGGFAQLDKDFSEYHIVIQGTKQIQQNEQVIKDTVMHAFLRPVSDAEIQTCSNIISFGAANARTNIGSLISAWIDDYNLTKDANTYWNSSNEWIKTTKKRMLEIQQTYANNHTWSVSYHCCSKEEAVKIKSSMEESHTKYSTRLKDRDHKRETALEMPVAINAFRDWSRSLNCDLPDPPVQSIQGSWTHFASPDFQLIKVAVRPLQRAQLHTTIDGNVLSYLSDIIGEVFPQEQFKLDGLRGAFSGSLAVVATYARNADQRCGAFAAWVDRYASPISVEDQEKIGAYYENHKDKFLTKWKEANASRKINAEAKVFEYVRQNCSDEYYVKDFKDTFTQVDHTIQNFRIEGALSKWNDYWADTQQIMTHHEETECDISTETELPDIQHSEPQTVVRKIHKTLDLKANPDVPLNQSIVTIARKGVKHSFSAYSETHYFITPSLRSV